MNAREKEKNRKGEFDLANNSRMMRNKHKLCLASDCLNITNGSVQARIVVAI